GLFPGSRRSEISYLLDDMLGAAALLRRELGRCQFLLPVADTLDPAPIRARAARASVDVKVIQGGNYEVMQVSDFLICASGSATLEAALFACPMVVIYRVNRLSQALLGWLVKIRYFGLVNIVAQEGVVTELLNDAVTPRRIADEALAILGDPGRGRAVRERLAEIRQSLGAPGVLQRIAGNMALEMGLSAQDEDETASF
ncbi:MAG: lipid-A-disaccharide synthase, partial [Nitrospinaceae bacterium]